MPAVIVSIRSVKLRSRSSGSPKPPSSSRSTKPWIAERRIRIASTIRLSGRSKPRSTAAMAVTVFRAGPGETVVRRVARIAGRLGRGVAAGVFAGEVPHGPGHRRDGIRAGTTRRCGGDQPRQFVHGCDGHLPPEIGQGGDVLVEAGYGDPQSCRQAREGELGKRGRLPVVNGLDGGGDQRPPIEPDPRHGTPRRRSWGRDAPRGTRGSPAPRCRAVARAGSGRHPARSHSGRRVR